uniref:Secreted protein n=1 Tax=Anguilla anguilla TaxID=7936 RepID=A0A0E9PVD7_ANGAN
MSLLFSVCLCNVLYCAPKQQRPCPVFAPLILSSAAAKEHCTSCSIIIIYRDVHALLHFLWFSTCKTSPYVF